MDRISDFRDLLAWKLAHELKLIAQALCGRPALRTRFEFRSQLSRAAESAPTNIAEGFGRYYHPEAARFARIAKAQKSKSLTTSSMRTTRATCQTKSSHGTNMP